MKVSKSLLQAIALGVALGGGATSCTLLDNSDEVKPDTEKAAEDERCPTDDSDKPWYNCPACGMG
jgi:hypothetical protein